MNNLSSEVSIINIKDPSFDNFDLKPMIFDGLNKPYNQKTIPTLVLYDDLGLQLFDSITYQPEYYLTECEIDILKRKSNNIADLIKDDSTVIELGSGSLRKTKILLDSLEKKRANINYYALDVMESELKKSLVGLKDYTNVNCHGLLGTYDDGMKYMQELPKAKQKTILWLGSSIGNLDREEAESFINRVTDCLNPGDLFIVGVDLRNSKEKIGLAYDDPQGVSREFILNGLRNSNNIIGKEVFNLSKFDFKSIVNYEGGYHESRYLSLEDQLLSLPDDSGEGFTNIELKKGEEINVEFSYKYSLDEISQLVDNVKLRSCAQFFDTTSSYTLNILYKPPFFFSNPKFFPIIPSISEWNELFKAWEYIVINSLSANQLLTKPISLRHPIIFYLGHIPAFLDIQLSNHLKSELTEPKVYAQYFERGIDPDVNDPTKCHPHSKTPDTWPSRDELITYHNNVKTRLFNILEKEVDKRLGRILSYVFEHQAMHLETLLYMLIRVPDLKLEGVYPILNVLSEPVEEAKLVTVKEGIVKLGIDDSEESDLIPEKENPIRYGWDNESPQYEVSVPSFRIQNRPVTNGEYLEFLKATVNKNYPTQWVPQNGEFEFKVRTLLGEVDMKTAINWPVSVSYIQAKQYAAWKNMRLPTEAELIRCLDDFQELNDRSQSKNIPENLRHKSQPNLNAHFRSWHPTEVTREGFQLFGNGWEITTSLFGPHPNYVRSKLYPGYSVDFFDNKHVVVLGSSYASHPRLSARSFRNFYQMEYGYLFSSFRCVA